MRRDRSTLSLLEAQSVLYLSESPFSPLPQSTTAGADGLLADLREHRRKRRGQVHCTCVSSLTHLHPFLLSSSLPSPPQLPPLDNKLSTSVAPPPNLDTVEQLEPPSHPVPPLQPSLSLSSSVRERVRNRLQQLQAEQSITPPTEVGNC